jgi:hypothetical protein
MRPHRAQKPAAKYIHWYHSEPLRLVVGRVAAVHDARSVTHSHLFSREPRASVVS